MSEEWARHAMTTGLFVLQIVPMTREDISAVLEIERDSHVDPWRRILFEEELNRSCSHLYVARAYRDFHSVEAVFDSLGYDLGNHGAPSSMSDESGIVSGNSMVSVGSVLPVVVGYVCFWKVADEIQIHNLAVHPAFRRRGIGRSLLVYGLRRGSELHGRIALLEVRRSNEPALCLYKSVGFRIVGQRPCYYDQELEGTAILMEMELRPIPGNES